MGTIFDIQRFAVHDGPGIRTTVFLKGCPLKCLWCHNPESRETDAEISFLPEKCIGCSYCVRVCPNRCHLIENDEHLFNRDRCERCGLCTHQCYARALEIVGREATVGEVLDEVLKDRPFYETSGGGMTISGGEPMAQFEFTMALLAAAKENDLHTCLETCGCAPFEQYSRILRLVDIFMYDLKDVDTHRHQEHIGVGNELILENLKRIDDCGGTLILRCPIVPGFNDRQDHFSGIVAAANGLSNVLEIHVLPYHPLGRSKSTRIGKTYPLEDMPFPDEKSADAWIKRIQDHTDIPVTRS